MSAQPKFPFASLDPGDHLRTCVAEALCALVESMAVAGEAHRARRCMDAVQKIVDETLRQTDRPTAGSPAAAGVQSRMEELQHRARNAETVLKLVE